MGSPSEVKYRTCWTVKRMGILNCGHEHPTIAAALGCLIPDGRSFIRAFSDAHPLGRSLNENETIEFLASLSRGVLKKGAAPGEVRLKSSSDAARSKDRGR